jgi:hypothetical protein
VFGSKFVGVAELDVFGRNDTWPFSAGAEELARAPMMRAVWKVLPGMKSCARWPARRSEPTTANVCVPHAA